MAVSTGAQASARPNRSRTAAATAEGARTRPGAASCPRSPRSAVISSRILRLLSTRRFQTPPEQGQAAMDVRLRGADRLTQDPGDLPVAQALHVAQDDGGSITSGQP